MLLTTLDVREVKRSHTHTWKISVCLRVCERVRVLNCVFRLTCVLLSIRNTCERTYRGIEIRIEKDMMAISRRHQTGTFPFSRFFRVLQSASSTTSSLACQHIRGRKMSLQASEVACLRIVHNALFIPSVFFPMRASGYV